jgi:hypothetical protein
MGFDCTVRYIEARSEGLEGDDLLSFQRAADRLREWQLYRYVDLLDSIDALRTRFPTAEVWLLVHGDDDFRVVMHIHGGRCAELSPRSRPARDFVRRAKEARYRVPPFEQIDHERVWLERLDAEPHPAGRERIYEALADVPGSKVDDRLVQALRQEEPRAWVTLAYVLGGRRSLLPRLLRELVVVWPERSSNALFVERLVSVCERRSRSDLGAASIDLPGDLADRLALRD